MGLSASIQFGTLYEVRHQDGSRRIVESVSEAMKLADNGKGDTVNAIVTLDLDGMQAINSVLSTVRQLTGDLIDAARLLRKSHDIESTRLADAIMERLALIK